MTADKKKRRLTRQLSSHSCKLHWWKSCSYTSQILLTSSWLILSLVTFGVWVSAESFTEDKETYFTEQSQDPRHTHPHTEGMGRSYTELCRTSYQCTVHLINNDSSGLINWFTPSLLLRKQTQVLPNSAFTPSNVIFMCDILVKLSKGEFVQVPDADF